MAEKQEKSTKDENVQLSVPRTAVEDQLINFKKHKKTPDTTLTQWGRPVFNKDATMTVGFNGPVLLQDVDFVDEIAFFDRERIPERVVHAKGAGAFGYFEVTHDITQYTAAKVFSHVGKRTPIAVRFSQVSGELGSADTVRDPRGFALKFYTEDGIWDLVGNNTPIFFIRDPILFPSFIHTQKRNPVTHVRNYDALWDFASLRTESAHQYLYLYGDRGIPLTYRNMNGFGSNTFKFVNDRSESIYVKFIYHSDQGVKNMDPDAAERLAGSDPDYHVKDLYNNIADGNFPSWTFYIQLMTLEQAQTSPFNPFDVTKVWPHRNYPLIPVGRFVLNRNPSNFFEEVEQIAFSPANLVPGIEPSPDKMLQGRLFAYHDTHLHRIGTNYSQLPVNAAFRAEIPKNYTRDGDMKIYNQGGAPNYHPNSFNGPEVDQRVVHLQPKWKTAGDVYRYDSADEDNFSQPSILWARVFDDDQRSRAVKNFASTLKWAAPFIQDRVIEKLLTPISTSLGERVRQAIAQNNQLETKIDLSKLEIS